MVAVSPENVWAGPPTSPCPPERATSGGAGRRRQEEGERVGAVLCGVQQWAQTIPDRMDRYPRKLLQGQDHNNTIDTNLDPHLPGAFPAPNGGELLLAARREPIA